MNLSNLHPAEGSKHSDSFRRGRGHASGNGKTAGKGHKARRHVPAHRDLVSRAARCRYTDVFRREDLQTSTPRRSLELM